MHAACAQTDGKAARNLLKLQLFRQFYVLVVAYIYITRIVVYLLRSTMPYRYVWLSDAAGARVPSIAPPSLPASPDMSCCLSHTPCAAGAAS